MSTGVGSPSNTPSRVGTLTPPSTATNGTNITRADFQRWAHEDRNHAQADDTRREREERRRFREEQKELYRTRGVGYKEAGKQSLQEAKAQVQKHKATNAESATSLRKD